MNEAKKQKWKESVVWRCCWCCCCCWCCRCSHSSITADWRMKARKNERKICCNCCRTGTRHSVYSARGSGSFVMLLLKMHDVYLHAVVSLLFIKGKTYWESESEWLFLNTQIPSYTRIFRVNEWERIQEWRAISAFKYLDVTVQKPVYTVPITAWLLVRILFLSLIYFFFWGHGPYVYACIMSCLTNMSQFIEHKPKLY